MLVKWGEADSFTKLKKNIPEKTKSGQYIIIIIEVGYNSEVLISSSTK